MGITNKNIWCNRKENIENVYVSILSPVTQIMLYQCHRKVSDFGGAKSINCIYKKRLQHKCFPVNVAKLLRSPILKNMCETLLLMLMTASPIIFQQRKIDILCR